MLQSHFEGHSSRMNSQAGYLHLPSWLGACDPSFPLFLSDPPFVSLAHRRRCNKELHGPAQWLSVHLFGKAAPSAGGSPESAAELCGRLWGSHPQGQPEKRGN